MIVGGYTMHLYCRNAGKSADGPATFDLRHHETILNGEFCGRTFSECRRAAIAAGWRFGRDKDVTCPTCVQYGSGTDLSHVT